MAITLRAGSASLESMAMAKGTSSPDFAAIWLGAVRATSTLAGTPASGSGATTISGSGAG
jgi:hypothetical protein